MITLKTNPDKAGFASGNGWAECWSELQTLSSNSREAMTSLGRAQVVIYLISLHDPCEVIILTILFVLSELIY